MLTIRPSCPNLNRIAECVFSLLIRHQCLAKSFPIFFILVASASAQTGDWHGTAEYRDPLRFESAVKRFENQDRQSPPPQGGILFIGSSSIRRWDSLAEDMAPLTTINRGIGGSTFNDLRHYADRIIIPYRPRAIVVYSGGNDINQNVNPTRVVDAMAAFVEKTTAALPECRIYILSIKVTANRWHMRSIEERANELIAEFCRQNELLTYIDVASGMLDERGKPNLEIFIEDMVHMNSSGYRIWSAKIKPILLIHEMQYEPSVNKVLDQPEPYLDPKRFENAILAFEEKDKERFPPEGAIVAVGSSTFRRWDSMEEDLAPFTIIRRGFGGSNTNDALHYADRIIIPYAPRAVIIYEGSNDLFRDIEPSRVADTYRQLISKVHTALPRCRLYIVSLKPSPRRWYLWDKMQETNQLLQQLVDQDERIRFIDIVSPMLDDKGLPTLDVFIDDLLHMNRNGYDIWTAAIIDALTERELPYERR